MPVFWPTPTRSSKRRTPTFRQSCPEARHALEKVGCQAHPSAICRKKSVLRLCAVRDFLALSGGYGGKAVHLCQPALAASEMNIFETGAGFLTLKCRPICH
jgi:hypothetical protein